MKVRYIESNGKHYYTLVGNDNGIVMRSVAFRTYGYAKAGAFRFLKNINRGLIRLDTTWGEIYDRRRRHPSG